MSTARLLSRRGARAGVLALALAAGALLVRAQTGDRHYQAWFAHASGLRTGDEVRVAGIGVGTVEDIHLDGPKAVVEFTVGHDVRITTQSRAAVKLASLLGQHYLEVVPGAGAPLDGGGTIPLARTASAYTLDRFWLDGNRSLEDLDLDELSRAVDVLGAGLDGSPRATGAALQGITDLSTLVATRDQQIGRLLHSTRQVTGVVHDQQHDLLRLVGDATLVTQMVYERRTAIRRLLRDTRTLVAEVSGLVADNQVQLRPMLRRLHSLLGVLTRNSRELDHTLKTVGPQERYFANATGNGPWVDVYAPDFVVPDNVWCPLLTPRKCR